MRSVTDKQKEICDNTTLAVARILGDGTRRRTRVFSELQSHYLFADRFGRPGKGNDKDKVEGLIGYARRNFLVSIPRFESFEALNDHLEARCRERQGAQLRGHQETIATRMTRPGGVSALAITSRRSSCRPSCASMRRLPVSVPRRTWATRATSCAWPSWS